MDRLYALVPQLWATLVTARKGSRPAGLHLHIDQMRHRVSGKEAQDVLAGPEPLGAVRAVDGILGVGFFLLAWL